MAEVGLIASVIGIAGAGAKLTVTLYTFAETVNSADKSIRDVARDVSITSSVLSQLASIMEQDKKDKISKENAIKTADEAVRGCSDVFKEIDTALEKSLNNINAGKTKAALERLKWAFNEPKMELLRSNLERMKSSLLLLLSVLSYARDIATDHLPPQDKTNRRSQIVELNRSKEDYQRRHEELLKAIESINIQPSEPRDSENRPHIPRKPVPMNSSRALPIQQPYSTFPVVGMMALNPNMSHPPIPESIPAQVAASTANLVKELAVCAAQVTYLLGRINSTPKAVQIVGPSAVYGLKYDYENTKTFLDQRLLTLDYQPETNDVADEVWKTGHLTENVSSHASNYAPPNFPGTRQTNELYRENSGDFYQPQMQPVEQRVQQQPQHMQAQMQRNERRRVQPRQQQQQRAQPHDQVQVQAQAYEAQQQQQQQEQQTSFPSQAQIAPEESMRHHPRPPALQQGFIIPPHPTMQPEFFNPELAQQEQQRSPRMRKLACYLGGKPQGVQAAPYSNESSQRPRLSYSTSDESRIMQEEQDQQAPKRKKTESRRESPSVLYERAFSYYPMSIGSMVTGSAPDNVVDELLERWTTVLDG